VKTIKKKVIKLNKKRRALKHFKKVIRRLKMINLTNNKIRK